MLGRWFCKVKNAWVADGEVAVANVDMVATGTSGEKVKSLMRA